MAEPNRTEATQEVQTIQNVAENLSELLTNSVNIVDKYYEIFFDPTPHYVELEQFDSNGKLYRTLIPNRALDRSVSLSGQGNPEKNQVEGVLGTLYVDTDSRDLYIKKTPEGPSGWVNITPQPLEYHTETFDVNSTTTSVLLEGIAYGKRYIDIYLNGRHLEYDDFELGDNYKTIYFNTQFPDFSKLQVRFIDGLYGLKGDTAISVNVGTVETVNSETPASVTNVGDDENLILNFKIPKGATGDTGVWIGSNPPVENEEYLEDKKIWIDTSAEGYSEADLGVTRIFDSGNNTNPTAYKRAYNIMHSSIDEAKYAKIGDVNVDDNGILTAYGNGSGIRTTIKVKQLEGKDWSISGRDYIDINKGNFQYLFNIGGQNTNSTVFYFRSRQNEIDDGTIFYGKSFCLVDKQDDVPNYIYDNNSSDLYDVYGAGWYNWKIEYKSGAYNIYISYEDLPLALRCVKNCKPIKQISEEYIYISADSVLNHSQMMSDLTKYGIRINGKLVWTPNVTGYEPIVYDVFNKVGNPVINEAGVLTAVSDGSHYINTNYKAKELLDHSWSIEGQFIHTGVSQVLWQFADPNQIVTRPIDEDRLAGDYKMMSVVLNSNTNQIEYYLRTGVTEAFSMQVTEVFDIALNEEYKYKFEYNESSRTYLFTLTHRDDTQTKTYPAYTVNKNPLVCNSHPEYMLLLGTGSKIGVETLHIHNDLNYFKVKIRNKLVYRPLFRIPCTYAKSGARFVDSAMRWMVNEAYELHAKGHMFLIDEENQAITLPLDDIYSLIQREYETRPNYGKGLKYDVQNNILENLTQGSEVGDVGESVFVDETTGMRKILNGQTIKVTKDTEEFAKYVLKLKDNGLVVTNEEYEAEVASGTCNKFVIDVENTVQTTKYHAYIPETFVIRTPIIEETPEEDKPDVEVTIEDRYCYNCGELLLIGQDICNNCGADNTIKIDDSFVDYEQEDESFKGPEENEGDEEGTPDIDPDKIIGYETSISDELTESDIVYITSFNILDTNVVFRKIDGIIYPEKTLTVENILNADEFYDYDMADFEESKEIESANYIRLPKLNASKAGYQCYIQIATGVKNTVDVENTYTHISPFSYGMYQYSDIELNNPGWLLSEGQWNNGSMYSSFYRWIRKQIDLGRDKFKLWNNPNYSVTRYDYVINEADGTFRLPLVASVSDFAQQRFLVDKKEATDADPTWYNIYSDGWCEQGGKEVINSASVAALNFTNKTMVLPVPILHAINWNVQPRHDCFGGNMGAMTYMASYESVTIGQKNMNAATAYTNPWVVWSLEGYVSEATLAEHFKLANLYFYVGDTVQTNNHIDTGKMMEDLAKLRAELDYARKKLNNTLSVPSGSYINISCPASGGKYTAPADGWLYFRRTATAANQFLFLRDTSTDFAQIQWIPAKDNWGAVNIPVRKGAVVEIGYNAGTHTYLRFIPERGVVI